MQCPHCGAELEAGNIYCKACGREIQIVPDYDFLDELVLGQEKPSVEAKKKEKPNSKPRDTQAKEKTPVKAMRWRLFALSGGILLCFLTFLISYFSISKNNSYSYQLKKGISLVQEEKYQEALPFLKQAQNLQADTEGTDISPLYYLAKAYAGIEYPEMAISCMEEAIAAEEAARGDTQELEALYLEYMEILNQARRTSKISEVIEACRYEEIRLLLLPYRIEKPSIDTPEGTYSRYLSLELEAKYGSIYYTLDGTEPTAESTRYDGPIKLQEEGEVLLTAVAINKKGMISDKLVLVYKLEFNNVYNEDEEV